MSQLYKVYLVTGYTLYLDNRNISSYYTITSHPLCNSNQLPTLTRNIFSSTQKHPTERNQLKNKYGAIKTRPITATATDHFPPV